MASSAAKRSNTSLTTSLGRASDLSTLLMQTIGLRPIFSALPTTNLVCGIGPSAASTSTIAPSTIDRMRSTSPPKSAWPGVSTILTRTSLQHDRGRLGENGDAALALEVAGIHDPLGDPLVLAEGARLLEQPVDERRLAVVDVGDDGDVAKLHGMALLADDGAARIAPRRCLGTRKVTGTRRRVAPVAAARRLCGGIHETTAGGKTGGRPTDRERRGRVPPESPAPAQGRPFPRPASTVSSMAPSGATRARPETEAGLL